MARNFYLVLSFSLPDDAQTLLHLLLSLFFVRSLSKWNSFRRCIFDGKSCCCFVWSGVFIRIRLFSVGVWCILLYGIFRYEHLTQIVGISYKWSQIEVIVIGKYQTMFVEIFIFILRFCLFLHLKLDWRSDCRCCSKCFLLVRPLLLNRIWKVGAFMQKQSMCYLSRKTMASRHESICYSY